MAYKKVTNDIKELLIAGFQKHPEIYDKGHDDYKSRDITDNILSKIAEETGLEGETYYFIASE